MNKTIPNFFFRFFGLLLICVCCLATNYSNNTSLSSSEYHEVTIKFENKGCTPIDLYWNNGGSKVFYATITTTHTQLTYPGHEWILKNSRDNSVLLTYTATSENFQIVSKKTRDNVKVTNNGCNPVTLWCEEISADGKTYNMGIINIDSSKTLFPSADSAYIYAIDNVTADTVLSERTNLNEMPPDCMYRYTISSCAVSISNTCPSTTVDLNSLVTNNPPSGTNLLWYENNNNPPTGTAITNPTTISTSGTYYAFYYDATDNCYSPASGAAIVTINDCSENCNDGIDNDGDGEVDCADEDCSCTCTSTITGVMTPSVYDDNGTPENLADDTYSFKITVQGQGVGWKGGDKTGSYGVPTSFGPYPVGQAASFKIRDTQNSSCFFSVSANMNACIYLETCTCCKAE